MQYIKLLLFFSIFYTDNVYPCYPCSKIIAHNGIEKKSGSSWKCYERKQSNLCCTRSESVLLYTNGPKKGILGVTRHSFKNPEKINLYLKSTHNDYKLIAQQFLDFKKYYLYQQQSAQPSLYESRPPGGPLIAVSKKQSHVVWKIINSCWAK